MSIGAHSTSSFPGPVAGVTLLGSALNLANYNDVTAAVASDRRVAILSIVSGHTGSDVKGAACTFADEDGNIVFVVQSGSDSSNEHGFLYPPLLPAGKKLRVKADSTAETNLVIYVQYMLVPV
jgi:hypothetical protein